MSIVTCPICDTEYKNATKHPNRSYDHLKYYFAMVKAAYENWPVTHERQFLSASKQVGQRECRKYLQMKAGHFEESSRLAIGSLNGPDAARLVEGAYRAAGKFSICVPGPNEVTIYTPLSIAYEEMSHSDAVDLFERVSWVIREEIGISGNDLLEQKGRPLKIKRSA